MTRPDPELLRQCIDQMSARQRVEHHERGDIPMPKIEDGGPAFPNVPDGAGDRYTDWDQGMSLRDWFAGQALCGRMARHTAYRCWGDAALDAYEMADAMLRARKGVSP